MCSATHSFILAGPEQGTESHLEMSIGRSGFRPHRGALVEASSTPPKADEEHKNSSASWTLCACFFFNLRIPFGGVLAMRALLLGVDTRGPDFWKLLCRL